MVLELKISATPPFSQIINAVGKIESQVMTDIRGAGDSIKEVVVRSWEKRFLTENKGQWAPLSLAYKAWKEVFYPGMPILQLTQTLRAGATGKGEGHIDKREPKLLEFGVDTGIIPYASTVQEDRVWCDLYPEDTKKIGEVFGNWMRKEADKIMGHECPTCGRPM